MGIEKNPDSVARAQANVAAAGLSNRVKIIEGDIFQLERVTGQFDYVLAEAILTMQSAMGKAKVLAGIAERLKPNGRFLSQELRVSGPPEDIYRELSTLIRVNAKPLSISGWLAAFQAAELNVERYDIGPMTLLNPRYIVQEEGIFTLFTMRWNMLTHPALRQRSLAHSETTLTPY